MHFVDVSMYIMGMNSEEIMHFTYVQFEAITPCTGFTYKQ